jgi:hypothetical protein
MARTNNGTAGSYLKNANAIANATPFTIAGWVKTTDNATTQFLAGLYDFSLSNEAFCMGILSDGTIFQQTKHEGGGELTATSGTISNNTWAHVAVVFASSSSRTPYLNGTAGTTATNTFFVPTPASLVITVLGDRAFGDGSFSGAPLKGKMAYWAMWNSALSGANITSLAGGADPSTIATGNLAAYWILAGTTSPEPDDAASFDMTIVGTMTGDTGDNPTIDGGGGAPANHNSFLLLGVG